MPFAAWVHGGNNIFVKPDQDLVIVMTALLGTNDEAMKSTLDYFQDSIRSFIEN